MRTSEIGALLRLEAALDLRQRAAWGGMVLYVAGAVYVAHQAIRGGLSMPVWNAVLWIILLFAAFNTLARSFQREDAGRQVYLHTLADPRSVVIARTLYNALTMALIALLTLGVYALLMGTAAMGQANTGQFVGAVVLGGVSFAAVLTLIAAIAARAGNGLGLMAILGFPLVLPTLLAVMRASRLALEGVAWSVNSTYFLALLLLDVIALSLAWVLFPYLWRD